LRVDASALASRVLAVEGQEREVAARHGELTRQLQDLQAWYRRKIKELADKQLLKADAMPSEDEPSANLSVTDETLADLLLDLHLIDKGTLAALTQQAQQRHQSLRQLLLEGDYLTAYQLELIEAGRLEALALGSLRIIDRLRLTPFETSYRVFDPERGEEALLRQLSRGAGSARVQEFRERFTRAMALCHPNVAATHAILIMDGCPAALQEWVSGVPTTEFLPWTARPVVWCELLRQATLTLQAAHAQGLAHGHLRPQRLLLTQDGVLKLCGIGEPNWLIQEKGDYTSDGVAGDWQALGHVARRWLGPADQRSAEEQFIRRADALVARLLDAEHHRRIQSAEAVLVELDELQGMLAADSCSWEQLLSHVRQRLHHDEFVARVRLSA